MRTNERFSGYRVLIGCFLVMFVHLGMLSSLGIFIPRMVPDLNETLGRVSLMTSFATIVAFVMSFITPKLLHKFSARVLLGVASVLCGIHFIMYGMAQNVYVLWAGASLGGVVLGCGTNAVIGTIISSWFIRKRSAIIGYVFGGAALGGAAVQFLGGRMIHAVGLAGDLHPAGGHWLCHRPDRQPALYPRPAKAGAEALGLGRCSGGA